MTTVFANKPTKELIDMLYRKSEDFNSETGQLLIEAAQRLESPKITHTNPKQLDLFTDN